MKDQKPTKRIAYCKRSWGVLSHLLPFLEHEYDIEITRDRDAEYVVYDPAKGLDVLKYSGVRISVTGENVSPEFSVADYALAHDQIRFRDRYLWFPYIRWCRSYHALTTPRLPANEALSGKTEFCAYVMSNTTNSADERVRIFECLSDYKTVNSGGKWRNNVGGRIKDKAEFQAKHKFVLACENSSTPGYLTEKFADGASANAIPIYWGDPDIASILNPAAFVNCHAFNSLDEVVARVKQIDQDDELYRSMLSEPWFKGGIEPECFRAETITSFLKNIFDGAPNLAYRRNMGRWGRKIEQRYYDMAHRPHIRALQIVRERWREIFLPSHR